MCCWVWLGLDGIVYAGASDKAKLYKITGPGKASVLYDFDRTEVRAIAVNKKGEVFAIANEIKSGNTPPSRSKGEGTPAQPTRSAPNTKGKGRLYKLSSDGTPDQLLDDSDEHYTSLSFSGRRPLLRGHGRRRSRTQWTPITTRLWWRTWTSGR